MLRIIDLETTGIPTVSLPDSDAGPHCQPCAAYRPDPELSGNLQVDPEIHLPSPGMDVDVAYYYNANSKYNGPFGYGRTISTNLTAQASVLANTVTLVTITRGNGGVVTYSDLGVTGLGYLFPQTLGVLNKLTTATVGGATYWQETTPDGIVSSYPAQPQGGINSIAFAQDAVGNTHTFLYSSGLLCNIQDGAGRLVTFLYSSGLLQTIQDWANRLTTFAYNTASVPGKALLTTVTGPTGCQTQYAYNGTPLLTGIIDPNGYATSYAYDASNRVVTRENRRVKRHHYQASG